MSERDFRARLESERTVEEAVHGLLQHALLVAQDHLGRLDVNQALEAVVADDDAPVEVVEVGRGKPAPFERHERAQLGGDDRDDAHDHPLGTIVRLLLRLAEGLDHLQALERVGLALLARLGAHLHAQVGGILLQVYALEERLDGLAADLGDELLGVVVVEPVVVVADLVEDVEILVLAQELERLHAERARAAGVDDDVVLVIDHLLEVLRLHAEEVGDLVGQALEVPDVHHRHRERDVTHALAAHRLLGHLDAAAVADDALVADALVLAAVALPVLDRAEDLLAEQAFLLRLERPVVDRLRLEHLTEAAVEDRLGRGQADGQVREPLAGPHLLRLAVKHMAVGYWLLAVGNEAAGAWLPAVGNRLRVLPKADRQQPTALR
jgi:hypothetical protein